MSKSYLAILGVLAILGSSTTSWACSCQWGGPFLAISQKTPLVVRGRILSYHGQLDRPHSPSPIYQKMEVEVIEVLKGQLNLKTMKVEGDNGVQCLNYVTSFPIGSEWVLAFSSLEKFQAGVCGEYALRVEGDEVVGSIEKMEDQPKHDERLKLSELRAKIGAPMTEIRSSRVLLR